MFLISIQSKDDLYDFDTIPTYYFDCMCEFSLPGNAKIVPEGCFLLSLLTEFVFSFELALFDSTGNFKFTSFS